MNTTLAIIVLLVGFLLLVFLRFPIAYAVAISSIACMLVNGTNLALLCKMMDPGWPAGLLRSYHNGYRLR